MKYARNGLVSILASLLIGCVAQKTTMLRGRIDFKYRDENYYYCCLPIENTKYSIMGRGKNEADAEYDAKEKLYFINEVIKPTVNDLEEADNPRIFDSTPHSTLYVIEQKEFEELRFRILLRNLQESMAK